MTFTPRLFSEENKDVEESSYKLTISRTSKKGELLNEVSIPIRGSYKDLRATAAINVGDSKVPLYRVVDVYTDKGKDGKFMWTVEVTDASRILTGVRKGSSYTYRLSLFEVQGRLDEKDQLIVYETINEKLIITVKKIAEQVMPLNR